MNSTHTTAAGEATPATDLCPLPLAAQRLNLILFAACTGIQYLAAPVLYVGITQASLCDRLGADARTSNLPGTLYFAMTAMPALIAWWSPRVSALKRNMLFCFGTTAVMLGITAAVLALPVPNSLRILIVVLQGGVSGAVMPAAIAFLWEVLGRGSDESRRGLALSLAFGVGPMLAVVGSLAQTAMLGGNLFGWQFTGLPYPDGFILLFGAGAPIMLVACVLSQFVVVPPPERELEREPIQQVTGLLAGLPMMFGAVACMQLAAEPSREWLRYPGYVLAALATVAFVYHFRSILSQRVLLLATVVTILVYSGNMIPSNMNLYSAEALGDAPEKFAGLQNTIRFSFKVVTGLFLGWMLTKTNPRAGILVTSAIFLAAQAWAILATGPAYLVAFGIYGAGELVGVYAPNYLVSASRKEDLRRNMAFVTMLMAPAAPAGYLYGALVDLAKSQGWTLWGMTSTAFGFRLSFFVCGGLIAAGIAVAWLCLPRSPRPARAGATSVG